MYRLVGVFAVLCGVWCQDFSGSEETAPNISGDISDFVQPQQQNWHALEPFAAADAGSWQPQEEQPKRRRIRKRKRRPIVEEVEVFKAPTIGEPWEELQGEVPQNQYVRRRLTPAYAPEEDKIRDPFTALVEAEEKQKKSLDQPDLKTLLKQNGGFSLSEVLQQKNLSLAELLMGKKEAISALTEATIEAEGAGTEKYRRLPPSVGLRREIDRYYERSEESSEGLSSDEVLEAQRKRLSLLHSHQHAESKLFTDVTKFDVVTEATTEKRIFVPSAKLEVGTAESTSETTTVRPVYRPKPQLPLTSARLSKPSTTLRPFKAIPIDVNEIFGFGTIRKNTTKKDEPLRMTIDLIDETTTKKVDKIENELVEISTKSLKNHEIEKLKNITAKEEIMEILQNPVDREHLSRILRLRNMTVEQLVEQRERGSSQLHLADIFHNKTKEPEPEEVFIGQIGEFRQAKQQEVPKQSEMVTLPQEYTITSFPTFKIELLRKEQPHAFSGIWKEIYPSLFSNPFQKQAKKVEQAATTTSTTTTTTETIIFEEVLRLDDVDNALAKSSSNKLNIELRPNIYEDESEFISLPNGVKSAILASLAIVGLSLIVFLTILVVFKWTQRQKRKHNYTGSFSGSRIKSPILESDHQKRSFRTLMSETIGRKRNHHYKSHLQSMSDSIWDTTEKKSYMI